MSNNVSATRESGSFIRFLIQEMKPRGKWLTPFNVISIPVILTGLVILYFRFVYGLGSVTNLSQEFPWGFWLGFDVITGVALAGGAYVITFVVYVMKVEKYYSIVRVTILNGLLAYIFYAGALLFDIGRPWHALNPYIGNSFGFSSVMFLICWHFLLYMVAAFIEFSPVIAEWAQWEKARKILKSLTLVTVILGITLSLLHQSGLGALFLMAKPKIHPLWWSEFIPILFFVSSIYAGLAMIIFEGTISHRIFKDLIDPKSHHSFDDIILGLAKGAAITMFVYYFLKALVFIHGKQWDLVNDVWGYWYLVEVLGFVLVPGFMFAFGFRNRSLNIIKIASVMALIGIVLNRLNVSIISFKWYAEVHYYPSWQEIVVTLMIIFAEVWIFRWIVTRMPVFNSTH
ncbi:MAG: NrfD/PsrC family molybdoenzyme membrane anchor subunit [Candidatus Desulfatibia sp.]|uniref:NrfD/PsrC family molybdoenzyme membrane anchor subunit n=1 Tax=Candidatus Desulfatibia sp. TaxID=3101189 RepID=UPI002F300115